MVVKKKNRVSAQITASDTAVQTVLVGPWALLYGSSTVRIGQQLTAMTALCGSTPAGARRTCEPICPTRGRAR